MARITACRYFRLATILVSLALVQVHVASGTTKSVNYPTCRFSIATISMYEDGVNLLARGNGSVTLQDVTCICHIGKPEIKIFFPQGEKNGSNQYTKKLETVCEDGHGNISCDAMPESCHDLDVSKVSKAKFTGTFTQSAVVTCESTKDTNRTPPLMVWVNPVPASTPFQSTSVAPSPSEIVMSTTATTEDDDDSTDVIDSDSFSSTTAESPACATLTNILTTTLTIFASDYMSPTLTSELPPTISPIVAPTVSAISILIIIIVVLLVVVTVAIIIARSNHRSGKEQISATNPIAIEHKEIHTEV